MILRRDLHVFESVWTIARAVCHHSLRIQGSSDTLDRYLPTGWVDRARGGACWSA